MQAGMFTESFIEGVQPLTVPHGVLRDAQAVATQVMSLEGGGAGRIVEDRRGGLDGDRIIEYADDRDEDDVAVGSTVLGNEEEEDEEDGGIGGGALAARPTDAVELERPKTARGGPGKDPFGYVSPGRPTRGTDHWIALGAAGRERGDTAMRFARTARGSIRLQPGDGGRRAWEGRRRAGDDGTQQTTHAHRWLRHSSSAKSWGDHVAQANVLLHARLEPESQ